MVKLLGQRLLTLGAAILGLAIVPMPFGNETVGGRQAVLVAATVFGIGKVLYDTLFYDHYRS